MNFSNGKQLCKVNVVCFKTEEIKLWCSPGLLSRSSPVLVLSCF